MGTLYEKLVARHTVATLSDEEVLLYVTFHIMNEYTSPQAFSGLEAAGRHVWRPEAHLGVVDHVNSTRRAGPGVGDAEADLLIRNFIANCRRHGIRCFGVDDPRQGIEHVVVPEQGLARPGTVIACGDSHTTTYGAFGALGFGIGTSEVEHVLATQTLVYRPLRPMRVTIGGQPGAGVAAKDLILRVIANLGAGAARGYAVEFAGEAVRALDMAGRMTVCNMAVEMGARSALIAPDEVVVAHLRGRPLGPSEEELDALAEALPQWHSDPDAVFAQEHRFRADDVEPTVSWGTSPDQSVPITGRVPQLDEFDAEQRPNAERAMRYMDVQPGRPVAGIPIDMAFIGSCTNARIEDLRAAAAVLQRTAGGGRRAGHRRLRLAGRAAAGGVRGARPRLHGGRLRVAAVLRLLDVPGDERRRRRRGHAPRLLDKPQLRGPPGARRTHAHHEPGHGRRGGRARLPDRRPGVHRGRRRRPCLSR